MDIEEARGFLMQAMRQSGWNQAMTLYQSIGILRAKAQGTDIRPGQDPRQFLNEDEKALLHELIWSFIMQGLLVPGLNDSNQGWPFLRLTDYGKRCLSEDRFLPHDPDGYLKEFSSSLPEMDPIILEYLTESLQCYLRGLNRAAAVMLGGASEQAILLLIESFADSIGKPEDKCNFKSDLEKARSIFSMYAKFQNRFSSVKNRLPKNLTENMDSLLSGVFDLIRNNRNDAGHPASGSVVKRHAIYSHLCLFPSYCERIYALIGWFQANQS